jgi:hypothetical protein
MKQAITLPPKGVFRLTLTRKALGLARLRHSKPITDGIIVVRPDGRFDVFIKSAAANLLRQLSEPKENLSDTLVRILGEKSCG